MVERTQATRLDEAISFAVPTTGDAVHAYYADPSLETAEALVAPDQAIADALDKRIEGSRKTADDRPDDDDDGTGGTLARTG